MSDYTDADKFQEWRKVYTTIEPPKNIDLQTFASAGEQLTRAVAPALEFNQLIMDDHDLPDDVRLRAAREHGKMTNYMATIFWLLSELVRP